MKPVRLITPNRLPPGVQSLRARVPMRLAECREVGCPRLSEGWSEVYPYGGSRIIQTGRVDPDEAAGTWGRGPDDSPPRVIFHEPGTPCPQPHKVPNGLPPVYTVDGRPVTETEWTDRLGEGAYTVTYLRSRG